MIDKQVLDVLTECTQRSMNETITFPEVVQKLAGAGVEFYYADYYRHQKTYYLPNGETHTEQMDPKAFSVQEISKKFSPDKVKDAIGKIQRREIKYREFLRLTEVAGVATYAVYINGKRVVYTGRDGDSHVEWFPGVK
jgi:uncharacterized protein YbcV (DUF1398 family)